MRVAITIDARAPHRDWVGDDAEFWLRHHARDRWVVRETDDFDGRGLLVFEFMDTLDGLGIHNRIAPAEHRGRLL